MSIICDNCRYTSDQLQTAKKQIKELEKELERSTKETTQQKQDALKTTEKMKNKLKTHKLQVIDLKTQERETQEKLQSVSEQLDSAIERLTKREDEINRLQTTLTNQPQPQPSNTNQLNQQLITKHKEEITNLTNIIEEKDTIIDQLIDYRIKHKQQPTAQPQRQQKTKRILLMGDSNANTINQHLHNKPTTYRLVTTFNLNKLNQQIQDYKDDINEYDQILILIGTNHLKLGQANDIHRDITAITQPLDQNKLLIIEPPRLSNTNHEIERKTLVKLHKKTNQKTINPYPINLILKPDGIHLTNETAQQTANELMKILETEPIQETHKTTPNKTNTSSNRPKTQQSQQSQQPQRSYRPRTNQTEDREKDYIDYVDLRRIQNQQQHSLTHNRERRQKHQIHNLKTQHKSPLRHQHRDGTINPDPPKQVVESESL